MEPFDNMRHNMNQNWWDGMLLTKVPMDELIYFSMFD